MLANVLGTDIAENRTNQIPALKAYILIGELEGEGAEVDNKQINIAC